MVGSLTEPTKLPRHRSPPGSGGNLPAASPTAPAAVGTRGLPAPASRARFPHVLLAAAQNYKLQRRTPFTTTGSLPFVPPPAAQPARPAPSCAHAGRPAGETPTAATTPAAGGELAGAAPEAPRRAASCALTPGRRRRTWSGRRLPSSRVPPAPPPRWPDGSLRRALRSQQVRPSARPGKRCALARLAGVRGCPGGRAARPKEHCLKSIAGLPISSAYVLFQRTTGETTKLCFGGDLRDQPAQTKCCTPNFAAPLLTQIPRIQRCLD